MAMLQLQHISKHFGSKVAVKDLSLSIEPGEIYGFLGPNGAGKTTTIRMVMDFIKPSNGTVKMFGRELTHGDKHNFNDVGYLSADSTLYGNWTAAQHIKFVSKVREQENNAAELVEQFALDTNTKVSRLSSGNKQKLALILALMHKPKLLILDEPTRGLDPILQRDIYNILKDFRHKGGAVFMSSHNLSEVQSVCDRVGIIRAGELVTSETMQSLRKLNIHEVTIVFAGPYDRKKFEHPNAEIKKATKNELIIHFTGDLTPLITQIAKHKVRDLEITHVSVEDMFMRFYQ